MKKSTIITIAAFALGIILLAAGFILLTDNNISNQIFTTTTTTTTESAGGEAEPKPDYQPMDFFKEDVSKYITVGQYKGLEIEVEQLEVAKEIVDLQVNILLAQEKEFTKVRDGKIDEKVIFSFDYTGYLTNEDGSLGEKFEGGASTDQLAYIDGTNLVTISESGTGGFIDGFAQGIKGHKVGETFKIDITFPETYQDESLAGQKTVFEIKINYIAQTNLTDGWVKEYSGGERATVAEFLEDIKSELNASIEQQNNQLLWNELTKGATVIEIPQQQFDYIYNAFCEEVNYYVQMYAMYGMSYTFEEMLGMFGFKSTDELKEYAKDYIKSDLVVYAIMQAEGLEITDEEFEALLGELIESTGKTREEVIQNYGGEESLKQTMLLNKVNKLVLKENTFVEKK